MSLLLLLAAPASALPLYDMMTTDSGSTGQCIVKNNDETDDNRDKFASDIEDVVYVYVSDDFASGLNATTNNITTSNGDNWTWQLTQDQAVQQVIAALETWNRESLGPVLVYAGESGTSL
jgi:hypothetical protein